MLTLILSLATALMAANAAGPHKAASGQTKRSNAPAHVHGQASLAMAFDGTKGDIELHMPAETMLGFEHKAKSPADLKTLNDAFKKLETDIAKYLVFDAKLGCTIRKEKMITAYEGPHGNVEAAFKVQCTQSPVGTDVVFKFHDLYPRLKRLTVQALADQIQTSAVIERTNDKLSLKKAQ